MNEQKCRYIYREAFMDEDVSFENLLFSICKDSLKTLEIDNETVSMLFLLPCIFDDTLRKYNAFYLYAAATDKLHRKNGYMERLINNALEDCDLVFLRPASEKLCDYYEKFGFKKITANSLNAKKSLIPDGCYKKIADISSLNDKFEEFNIMYYSKNEITIDTVIFNHSMN